LGALLAELAELHGNIEAIVLADNRITYRELWKRVNDVARGLLARGLGKGDHIAILMGNRPEWIVFWMAINRIGAVAVGISTWSSATELSYILRHSDARMLIYCQRVGKRDLDSIVDACLVQASWSPSSPLSATLPCLRQLLRLPAESSDAASLHELVRDGTAVPMNVLDAIGREIRPGDTALLLYTSGSTATPKGVQLVHRILIENGYDIGEAERIRAGDRFWVSLPLFWSAGSANSAMATMTHGATIVLQEYFEAEEAARILQWERCTHYFAFPNVTQAVHSALGASVKLPAAKVAVSTGQPEILAMLRDMGFSLLLHPYGTTEDYGFATINGEDETDETLGWSQGRPLPGMELVIRDPSSGIDMPRGESGEICLRGNVTVGYYKDEDKNRAAFDDDGYFHTGDIAIQHADGRLQFMGRSTEMIKTSGFNVSPAEIEVTLLAVPGVAEAYAVGLPDKERGQSVVACIRASTGDLSRETLERHCAASLSSYKVPRDFLFFDSFPLTATGKISKKELAQLAQANAAPRAAG
jgi:fatty-acyl-CoA synthase